MTALSSDNDSADASCHVTSTGNTSVLTYHRKSRSTSSKIIFPTAMHVDSSNWPHRGNSVFEVKRLIASDCCDHVGDDELAHNSQNDIDFANDMAAAQEKTHPKKKKFEKALPAMICQASTTFADMSSASRPRYVSVGLSSATQCSKLRSTGSGATIDVLTVACGHMICSMVPPYSHPFLHAQRYTSDFRHVSIELDWNRAELSPPCLPFTWNQFNKTLPQTVTRLDPKSASQAALEHPRPLPRRPRHLRVHQRGHIRRLFYRRCRHTFQRQDDIDELPHEALRNALDAMVCLT